MDAMNCGTNGQSKTLVPEAQYLDTRTRTSRSMLMPRTLDTSPYAYTRATAMTPPVLRLYPNLLASETLPYHSSLPAPPFAFDTLHTTLLSPLLCRERAVNVSPKLPAPSTVMSERVSKGMNCRNYMGTDARPSSENEIIRRVLAYKHRIEGTTTNTHNVRSLPSSDEFGDLAKITK